jgi:uncharacterized protein (DUF488 family)
MASSTTELLTIGYDGRTPPELVDELTGRGVDTVVDVRLNPSSRKPGFSKRSLSATVEAAGMTYLHMPELGLPRDDRDGLHHGRPEAQQRYLEHIHTPEGEAAVERIVELAGHGRVCLLCLEHEPDHCHRRLVAGEAVRRRPGLRVTDIP